MNKGYLDKEVPLLVERAVQEGWCIYEDYCLLRIIYDYACKGYWKDYIECPAYKNLSAEQEQRVIYIINKLKSAPPEVVKLLNYASLKWRNKL